MTDKLILKCLLTANNSYKTANYTYYHHPDGYIYARSNTNTYNIRLMVADKDRIRRIQEIAVKEKMKRIYKRFGIQEVTP